MERLTLAYGGLALNFLGGPNPDCLGCAGLVYEYPSEEKTISGCVSLQELEHSKKLSSRLCLHHRLG